MANWSCRASIDYASSAMVLSLWSFNLSLLVNSVIHWSHGPFFVIFQSVFVSESCFAIITFELVIHFMVHFNVNMLCHKSIWILNRWCDFFPCALLTCDCEQISFCTYHIWTCSSCHIPFWCGLCHTVNTLVPDWWWIFSCDS